MSRRRALTREFKLEHTVDSSYSKPYTTLPRIAVTLVTIVLLPPFVMLALVPMLLMLLPVAFCAIPFVLSAFMGQAREVIPTPRVARQRAFRPATI